MTSIKNFAVHISENTEALALEVVDAVIEKMQLNIPEWERDQAQFMYNDFFRFLGESLINDCEDEVPETLLTWSKKNSEMQLNAGGDITEIVVRYPPTRVIFNDMITRLSVEYNLSLEENALIIKKINHMLDVSLNETFFYYKKLSDKCRTEQQEELIKLSAPIVPIQDDIVIIPLIGYMDEHNVNHIVDNVIPRVAEMEVNHVIADFSGALTIDSQMVQLLQQLVRTLSLMGVEVIITGLRPDLVQTIVKAGIDISSINSFSTVKQAVERI